MTRDTEINENEMSNDDAGSFDSPNLAMDFEQRGDDFEIHVIENGSEERDIDEVETQGNADTGKHGCRKCDACESHCCNDTMCNHLQSQANGVDVQASGESVGDCKEIKTQSCCIFRKSTNVFFSGFCMLVVTGLSVADIATDVLTAKNYYQSSRHTAFLLSLLFLIIPPIVLTAGILKRRDDHSRNSNSQKSCICKIFIVIANVPLKLYMIWLQLLYSFKCFQRFHRWRVTKCAKKEETLLKGSLRHFVTELSLYKLWNSIFESTPQLLLTIHVIMTTQNILGNSEGYLLIISSVFSFGSLCVGIIFYSVKSKESESQPVEESSIHPVRSKSTLLQLPQIVFLTIYTVCFLSSRAISFSYFILCFEWYASILPAIHWIVTLIFFSYRRYLNKNNKMHSYRMKAYKRRSSSYVYVLVHSLVSVFIHIKPECGELLDQPRYYKIIYYFFYILENSIMILSPMAFKDFLPTITDQRLKELQYLPLTYATFACMGFGAITCSIYHFCIHKSAPFTREEVCGPCCKCCYGPGGFLCFSCTCCCEPKDDTKVTVICKNIHNHEIRSVCMQDMKTWKQSTESKILNEKILRKWKIVQNSFNTQKSDSSGGHSTKMSGAVEKKLGKSSSIVRPVEKPDDPYTMRRTGLHILSDPGGNLFYAPISEIKSKTYSRNSERGI